MPSLSFNEGISVGRFAILLLVAWRLANWMQAEDGRDCVEDVERIEGREAVGVEIFKATRDLIDLIILYYYPPGWRKP